MKRVIKLCICAVALIAINLFVMGEAAPANASKIDSLMSKSTYFAGKYKLSKVTDESFARGLEMNQYSSYDSGNEIGNFKFVNCLGGNKPSGKLVRIGKNKYKCKNFTQKGTHLIFQVKNSKTVVVKQQGKKLTYRKEKVTFSGTYKLKGKHWRS